LLADRVCVTPRRYREHKNCNTLVCFVYDPDNVVSNPAGLCADLEKLGRDSGLPVFVVINPTH
jgi:REase_DpnII-MboI